MRVELHLCWLLAEYFGSRYDKNKYSMVFIAFGGEESGLIGSKFFVENSYFPIRNTALVLNFDLMGTGDEGIL
jgi:aminopeptidase YwaD